MSQYKISKIDNDTWQIEDLFKTYCYLIVGQTKAILFDAGNGFSGLTEIIRELTDKQVEVILSHGHFDHSGCSGLFDGCRIHAADIEVLKSGFEKGERKEKSLFFQKLYKVTLSETEEEFFENVPSPSITSYLMDGECIDLGNRVMKVIETPGHTKGSICLIDEKNRYLFSGDTVCDNEILVYFDHSTTVSGVRESERKLLAFGEKFDKIWPGHHRCPLDISIVEDYIAAADQIIENPGIGTKVMLDGGYKILHKYKTIGISYLENKVTK